MPHLQSTSNSWIEKKKKNLENASALLSGIMDQE